MREAEKVANQLVRRDVDLSEAEKMLDIYVQSDYNEEMIRRYLDTMAKNPPPRSKQSQRYFRGMRDIWNMWKPELGGKEKAMAWGWGVRIAKARTK
ncbi:hypothetical protein J7M22_18600 [Candidatus Poribacteria bacterium]|nr:hypothetical protein [Candidatus Poribacteria bacterium]